MSSSEEDSSSSEDEETSSSSEESSDTSSGDSSSLDDDLLNFKQAFLRRPRPLTGGWKSVSEKVLTRIYNLTEHRSGKFWIGKTSGGLAGCRSRWGKYKSDGMNRMATVYRSESEDLL